MRRFSSRGIPAAENIAKDGDATRLTPNPYYSTAKSQLPTANSKKRPNIMLGRFL
jgi:hypothetical protein